MSESLQGCERSALRAHEFDRDIGQQSDPQRPVASVGIQASERRFAGTQWLDVIARGVRCLPFPGPALQRRRTVGAHPHLLRVRYVSKS